jgi:hypothetical protein
MATPLESLGKFAYNTANGFLYGNHAPQTEVELFPWNVRYALTHKDAMFSREEIITLTHSGFADLAAYLIMKELNTNIAEQKDFLERYTKDVVQVPQDPQAIKHAVAVALNHTLSFNTKGEKLAQISRQGFDLWNEKFKITAGDITTEGRTPILVDYGAFIGLRHFIDADNSRPVMLVMSSWIQNPASPLCGYTIEPNQDHPVKFLFKDFKRPDSFAVVDHTRRSDEQINTILQFLGSPVEATSLCSVPSSTVI